MASVAGKKLAVATTASSIKVMLSGRKRGRAIKILEKLSPARGQSGVLYMARTDMQQAVAGAPNRPLYDSSCNAIARPGYGIAAR